MVLLSLLLVLSAVQAAATGSNTDQGTFQRLETEWNRAHLRADASVLDRLYGADVVIVVPGMSSRSRTLFGCWRRGE